MGVPRQPQQEVKHPRLGKLFPEPFALDGKDQFVASTWMSKVGGGVTQ
ncbi:MAG: hypothetical protein V3S25_09640 [Nitrospirales bacterium]